MNMFDRDPGELDPEVAQALAALSEDERQRRWDYMSALTVYGSGGANDWREEHADEPLILIGLNIRFHFTRPPLNLAGADLRGTCLRKLNLTGANFKGADLRTADLGGAYLRLADFRGADLRHCSFHGALIGAADFRGARITCQHFTQAAIDDAVFDPDQARRILKSLMHQMCGSLEEEYACNEWIARRLDRSYAAREKRRRARQAKAEG